MLLPSYNQRNGHSQAPSLGIPPHLHSPSNTTHQAEDCIFFFLAEFNWKDNESPAPAKIPPAHPQSCHRLYFSLRKIPQHCWCTSSLLFTERLINYPREFSIPQLLCEADVRGSPDSFTGNPAMQPRKVHAATSAEL